MRQRGEAQARKNARLNAAEYTIRAIICGPSIYGKTNVLISLLESPNGIRFENVYIYSKSLQQPKYRYLENLFTSIGEIGYFTFSNNSDVILSSVARQILFLSLMMWHAISRMR